MRIFLLEVIDEDRCDGVETRYPPMGLAYLAGYLKMKHVDWEVRIGRGSLKGGSILSDDIFEFAPDVIGVSFVSQNARIAAWAVRHLRQRLNVPIVLGGHHVSALPYWADDVIGVDNLFVITGEGEIVFNQFCEVVDSGNMNSVAWSIIPGLVYVGETYIVIVPRNFQYPDLDVLPQPLWGLFLLDPARDIQIFTSRGCPFDCIFCSSACFWGKPRYHSPKRVVEDIRALVDRGARNFNIYDDLFAMNKNRVRAIIKFMKKDSTICGAGVSFSCLGRASTMDAEMAGLLREMGVQNIAFGLESGSDRILKKLKGPTATVEGNLQAVDVCKDAGMNVVGSVIYGVPGETAVDVQLTIKMLQDMELSFGEAYLATPYPGTQLWDYAKKKNLVDDTMDFSRLKFDWDDDAVIVSDKLSLEELKNYRDQFKAIFG